ncbi:uncharacterized protein [Physcomitrium patens]|uniref:MYND-type domain-containing protein n=1 Tax=Physcomitrium patens TaxID=3218 RepID=A9TTP7_PHYPA|nr:zinc finger MYND domain-containing protein 15-like [Physcomitrium patens]PNR48531.1 hypothetical protein PHYPA_013008 [Physcomitrium patens]|eukprot:XP_024383941.1 zinc finger MYND domain-containing protein 15-like [Physcomitrella patens]
MDCAGGHLRGSCSGPATLRCGACGAIRYCSRKHQKAHWDEHALVCSRMAHQMQLAPVLYDFPFAYTHHTTRLIETQETSLCLLLESWDVHGEGLWAASCGCFQLATSQRSRGKDVDWRLPTDFCPCKAPEGSPAQHLQSWEEYYNWRGISFESPAALILTWPLSLYHAVCLAQSQTICSRPRETLLIHYLGPEKELEQLPAFVELLALLPAVEIHIDFVGPAVSKSADRETHTFSAFAHCSDLECACKKKGMDSNPKGLVTTRLWRGFYHDRHAELGRNPDLIFAANAGIAAFPSWHPTLELIVSLNVPALFTDYCEEAAVLATETIHHVIRGKHPDLEFPVQVNPFRQPLSPTNKDLDLPTFSNAFVFGIHGPSNARMSQETLPNPP